MKNILLSVLMVSTLPLNVPLDLQPAPASALPVAEHVFIITLDGFRWQEVFNGADKTLLNDSRYTTDTSMMNLMYWTDDLQERRKKLLPFFWNVVAVKGQLFGNRHLDSKVNTANGYSISYPGYNEILTGNTDVGVSSNQKINNPNINVLEFLDSKEEFRGKVAAFSSWDVFPYILNTERNGLYVNSGYAPAALKGSAEQELINKVQEEYVYDKTYTRYDELTFLTAKEYIKKHNPRLVFIGLGETDEFAHQERYDLYLAQASKSDRMIAELWYWVQTTPGYKDNTTFIITTDHGRGSKHSKWGSHGEFIKGSSQTWLDIIGPGIEPLGEMVNSRQLYQVQLAQTIAGLLGERFETGDVAPAISLK